MNIRAIFFCFLAGLTGILSAQQAIHLDSRVNTEFEEREPILSPDGKTMYFWRKESPVNLGGIYDPGDIWVSRKDAQGNWQEAEHLPAPINGQGHDFVWQVSPRHDTLWINQNPPGVNDISPAYVTRQWDGRWSPATRVNIRDISYQGQYKDFFLTPERFMLLPNATERGFGGTDLFVSFPINDTAWGRPINLGSSINTEFDEDAPFLSPDGRTLYFNSNGHGGQGDHDIFVSRRLDNTWRSWSPPESIGAPVNTRGYEFDFVITADGKEAYWCSDTRSYGSNDIFYMKLEGCEISIYPEGDQEVCIGQSLTLEAGYLPGERIRYQWYANGQALRGGNQRTLRVAKSGEFQLIRSVDGCVDTSEVKRVRFIPPPTAEIEAIGGLCLDDSIQLVARSSNGIIYQWQLNGLDIPAATDRIHWSRQPGLYTVRISNGSCASTSSSIDLQRLLPPSIYTAADTVHGVLPTLPQWLWTNKLPKEKRGSPLIQQIASGPNGESYVLGSVSRRGKFLDQIYPYAGQGIAYASEFPELEQTSGGNRYLVVDPEGDVILADNDRYLSKYNRKGQLLWSTQEARQQVIGLAVDPLGNIYSSGRFDDTLNLGREQRATQSDREGLFLAKHSPRGELLWLKTYSVDRYPYDFGNALHTDCMGHVYLAGGFRLIANFKDPVLRAGLRGDNFFVVKFSPEGDLMWGKSLQTDRTRERTNDIHVDCEGNTYLALNRTLYRLNTHGKEMWKGELLQPKGAMATKTRLHSADKDLYIVGHTNREEVFVSKLNRLDRQVILWQDKAGVSSEGNLPAITADPEGNILIAGVSKGSNFPGAQFDLTSGSYAFLMKYGRQDFKFEREAIELCGREPLTLFTREREGVSYQWLKDGQPIGGARNASLLVYQPGSYQVQATNGQCKRISDPQQLVRCGEEGKLAPPIAVVEVPKSGPVDISPTPPTFIPKMEEDIRYAADGSPKKLKNRKVKFQNEILIRSNKAVIYIWDHASADGDTISLNINGEWVLEEYELVKERIAIEFEFKTGSNHIMLFAHNLGTTPPNTASIMVDDGVRRQTLQLRSTLRNCGSLTVRKE